MLRKLKFITTALLFLLTASHCNKLEAPAYNASLRVAPGAGPREPGREKPCNSRTGAPHPDQGSGNCTGNLLTIIPLGTTGFSLVHNSLAEAIQIGFGKGVSFTGDQGFTVLPTGEGVLILGDGTAIGFHLDGNKYVSNDLRLSTSEFVVVEKTATQTDRDGSVTTYKATDTLPKQFGITKVVDRDEVAVDFSRDPQSNRLTQITDTFGKKITIGYTGGLATTITDFAGNHYDLGYTTLSRLRKVSYPDGRQWLLSYDGSSGRLSQTLNANGEVTNYKYYVSGDLGSLTNAWGFVTVLYYTPLTVTLATQFDNDFEEFDVDGALIRTSHNSATTTIDRDQNNRVATITSPNGEQTKFHYDSNDPLADMVTYPGGRSVQKIKYNAKREVLETIFTAGQISVTKTFDPSRFGVMTSTTNGSEVTKYTYDDNGNLKAIFREGGEEGKSWKLAAYSYNFRGQVEKVTDSKGLSTSYTYDSNGYLSSITGPLGHVVNYFNDALGVVRETNTGTLRSTYDYSYTNNGMKDQALTNSPRYQGGNTSGSSSITYFDNGAPERIMSSSKASGSWEMREEVLFASPSKPGNVLSDILTNSLGETYVLGK